MAEVPVIDYQAAFCAMVSDSRYLRNLDWGGPRPGHPEGSVRAHIAELENNLAALRDRVSDVEYWKLRLLIHSHDTFKADALANVAISHPQSHASLASAFLAEFCADTDLIAMVQYHDEPFALWRQAKAKGKCNSVRLATLLDQIQDWNLFLAFNIIDGCTEGKGREPLIWFFVEIDGKRSARFSARDLL
jgi:hypothetical protein